MGMGEKIFFKECKDLFSKLEKTRAPNGVETVKQTVKNLRHYQVLAKLIDE